jgi:hypothetical protein
MYSCALFSFFLFFLRAVLMQLYGEALKNRPLSLKGARYPRAYFWVAEKGGNS